MAENFDEKFDLIFKELENQKDSPKQPLKDVISTYAIEEETKKKELQETELQAYYDISLHYRLVVMAIKKLNNAINAWLNAILPILLEKHSLSREEWDRISAIGDNDHQIEQTLNEKWKHFFDHEVKGKRINPEIWKIIQNNHDL